MKRFIAVVTEKGTTSRFPIYAETRDIAKKKLRKLYPAELVRIGQIRMIISPYSS